jgi:pilus assembly protein CpaB
VERGSDLDSNPNGNRNANHAAYQNAAKIIHEEKNMKKWMPFGIALLVFFIALVLNQPEKQIDVVVAAVDLPDGHVLVDGDLTVKQMPKSIAPAGAVSDPKQLVGQRLRVARSAGDPVLPSHLGGEALELKPNERAVALRVTMAQGVAGLIMPGDHVGITAIIEDGQQLYAKYLAGGLRILWVDPAFRRDDIQRPVDTPSASSTFPSIGSGISIASGGAESGLIVLAVPVDAKSVTYDFSLLGTESASMPVYLIDLLPALSAQGVKFGLVLEPKQAAEIVTSGLVIQSLVITPVPTLTPTPTPVR